MHSCAYVRTSSFTACARKKVTYMPMSLTSRQHSWSRLDHDLNLHIPYTLSPAKVIQAVCLPVQPPCRGTPRRQMAYVTHVKANRYGKWTLRELLHKWVIRRELNRLHNCHCNCQYRHRADMDEGHRLYLVLTFPFPALTPPSNSILQTCLICFCIHVHAYAIWHL